MLLPKWSACFSAHFLGCCWELAVNPQSGGRGMSTSRGADSKPSRPGAPLAVTPEGSPRRQDSRALGCHHTVLSAEVNLFYGQVGGHAGNLSFWNPPGSPSDPRTVQRWAQPHSSRLVYITHIYGKQTQPFTQRQAAVGQMALWHQTSRSSCCLWLSSPWNPRPPALCRGALARQGFGALLPRPLASRLSVSATALHRGHQPTALPKGSSEA